MALYRNYSKITQIVYDPRGSKIEVVPGATVDADEWIEKYRNVFEPVEVKATRNRRNKDENQGE